MTWNSIAHARLYVDECNLNEYKKIVSVIAKVFFCNIISCLISHGQTLSLSQRWNHLSRHQQNFFNLCFSRCCELQFSTRVSLSRDIKKNFISHRKFYRVFKRQFLRDLSIGEQQFVRNNKCGNAENLKIYSML